MAEPEPGPSNAFDLDHITYYPYVDAFFTDKRIAEYCRQAIRDPQAPHELLGRRPPLSVAQSVAAISEAINF